MLPTPVSAAAGAALVESWRGRAAELGWSARAVVGDGAELEALADTVRPRNARVACTFRAVSVRVVVASPSCLTLPDPDVEPVGGLALTAGVPVGGGWPGRTLAVGGAPECMVMGPGSTRAAAPRCPR